jgi:hypothetical protein
MVIPIEGEAARRYVVRGLRRSHLKWSDRPEGFIVLPTAVMLRSLRNGPEVGLSVFHSNADLDALLASPVLRFKALAAIDVDALSSRGFRIETKSHDLTAAEILGLPPPDDPRALDVAWDLLPALRIIRPPSLGELAALRLE